jgi:hypothetical protein
MLRCSLEAFLFGGQVLRLGAWLPALQELHLCANSICSLAAPDFGCDAAGGSAMLARLQARPGPACKQSTPFMQRKSTNRAPDCLYKRLHR